MTDAETLEIRFTLDGQERTARIDKKDAALPLLREQMGCTTLKAGCSPQGVCGCCAAIVGGKPRLTCTLPAKTLDGKEVLTQQGLPPEEALQIARAFASAGLAQEGYVVPGLVMALVGARQAAAGAPLTADDAARALQLHAVRGFGWGAVIDAFLLADRALRGEVELPPALPHQAQAVLGRRPAVDDLQRPGMLHAALVLVPSPHARIQALDTAVARALPGVKAVLTRAELPGALQHGACVADAPLLVGEGKDSHGPVGIVALVAAETLDQARAAAAAVALQIEPLAPVTDAHRAAGHPEGILRRVEIQRGDARATLEGAAFQVRVQVETRGSDPAPVEPEAALAVPLADGRFRVWGGGQDLFRELEQLSSISGLDPDRIELIHLPVGGAYGTRMDLLASAAALLLAQATGRPVKLALEMAESTRLHAGRPPTWTSVHLGCDAQGRLLGLKGRVLVDLGPDSGTGPILVDALSRQAELCYAIPDLALDVLAVRTDNARSGAGPGLGLAEYAFAVETALDRLAALAGLDPLRLREQNLLAPQAAMAAGWTLDACWDPGPLRQALATELSRLRAAGHQVGIALGGLAQSLPEDIATAELEVVSAGHVRIWSGFSELGQGFDRRAIDTAARHSGLPADLFELVTGTARDVPCGPSMAGRDRRLGLPAVADAAQALAAALDGVDGELDALVGCSFAAEASAGPAMGLCAQAVAIDAEGGIAELVVVVDVGTEEVDAALLGLIQGAAQQALEQAVTAERELAPDGLPDTRWTKLGLLKPRHAPPITVIAVPGPRAVPIEDSVAIPTAAALANALHAASGQWQTVLPMKEGEHARRMGVRQGKKGA